MDIKYPIENEFMKCVLRINGCSGSRPQVRSSHWVWSGGATGLTVFSKTLLKTNSLGRNVRDFTRQLCKFGSLYWYDAMRTVAASRSSSVVSRSLAMALTFAFLRISTRTLGIPIYVRMMASIPYLRANGDTPVGFRLVVL